MVELRVDAVSDPDVAGALEGRRLPAIVTCRPEWEGGHFAAPKRSGARSCGRRLHSAPSTWTSSGARTSTISSRPRPAVASSSRITTSTACRPIWPRVPRPCARRARKSSSWPSRRRACATACRSSTSGGPRKAGRRQGDLVLIGMGECGLATRVLPGKFGSRWTYAGLERHVGQTTPAELLELYRFRSVTAATDVYGLVGLPVSHSVSPAMHNAAFRFDGPRRRLPAVSGRRRRRLHDLRARIQYSRGQRHHSL